MEIQQYIDTLDRKIYTVGENYKDSKITKIEVNEKDHILKITTEEAEYRRRIISGMCKNKEGQLFKLAPNTSLN